MSVNNPLFFAEKYYCIILEEVYSIYINLYLDNTPGMGYGWARATT